MTVPRLNAVLQRIRQVVGPRTCDSASDAQLLTAYLAGEANAFETLVQRHGRMVRGACWRLLGNAHDADDAFQAVFLVLARKASSLTQRENVAGWLYGVACRTAKKARVSTARQRRREEMAASMTRESTYDEATEAVVSPVLDEEVNRLPENTGCQSCFATWKGKAPRKPPAGCVVRQARSRCRPAASPGTAATAWDVEAWRSRPSQSARFSKVKRHRQRGRWTKSI